MISYQQALAILYQQAKPLGHKNLTLQQALGHVVARPLTSPINLPRFRNSAMDGYAVIAAEMQPARAEKPVCLPILQKVAAGDTPPRGKSQTAMHIMTGAPIPEPYDAIVPVELVDEDNGNISITQPYEKGAHVRLIGQDVKEGALLIEKGATITAHILMLLAAVGINTVDVMATPSLFILSTGHEVLKTSAALEESAIHDSNTPYLLATARQDHLHAEHLGHIQDDPYQLEALLERVPPQSIIISTGAVSKGVWDFIPATLQKLGARVHFHRVNIRPGKPVLFATLSNGTAYFGLPGNPISTAVGYAFFVQPYLRACMGIAEPQPMMARLTNDFDKKGDFTQFLKAHVTVSATGQMQVEILEGQESFKIGSFACSNAWVQISEEQMILKAGAYVPTFLNVQPTPQTRSLTCLAA